MMIHTLSASQELPINPEMAWDFFSSPHNLPLITPPHMGFHIQNELSETEKMFAGQIIVYDLKPFPFWKTRWVTEITHVEKGSYFIDEQRIGPYRLWHHLHRFEPSGNGVLVSDLVHYSLPWGQLGYLANTLFVKKQLNEIFAYRRLKLEELFGKTS